MLLVCESCAGDSTCNCRRRRSTRYATSLLSPPSLISDAHSSYRSRLSCWTSVWPSHRITLVRPFALRPFRCTNQLFSYPGNTLIQKIFERASVTARLALLERIGPHLAAIGFVVTRLALARRMTLTPLFLQHAQERYMGGSEDHPVRPDARGVRHHRAELATIYAAALAKRLYVQQRSVVLVPLFAYAILLTVGNYVVQGALRFGSPTSDFVFDAMIDRCWEIGSGRFGARSTRQTLENPLASRLNIVRPSSVSSPARHDEF